MAKAWLVVCQFYSILLDQWMIRVEIKIESKRRQTRGTLFRGRARLRKRARLVWNYVKESRIVTNRDHFTCNFGGKVFRFLFSQ